MRGKKTKRTSALKRRVKVPSAEKIYMVKRTFPGVTYGNIPLERGRLIRMLGLANDQKMLRLEYIEELLNPDGVTPSECGVCGAEVVGILERDGHFKRAHRDVLAARERTVQDLTARGTYGPNDVGFHPQSTPDDIETEQIIQRENEISPLRLDKTAASRK